MNFWSGRVAALKLELNEIFCIIQSQHLTKSAIDGAVVVAWVLVVTTHCY